MTTQGEVHIEATNGKVHVSTAIKDRIWPMSLGAFVVQTVSILTALAMMVFYTTRSTKGP